MSLYDKNYNKILKFIATKLYIIKIMEQLNQKIIKIIIFMNNHLILINNKNKEVIVNLTKIFIFMNNLTIINLIQAQKKIKKHIRTI